MNPLEKINQAVIQKVLPNEFKKGKLTKAYPKSQGNLNLS